MSKKEFKSISNGITDADLDLVVLDLHTQVFNLQLLDSIPWESEAVSFAEHRPWLHQFLQQVILRAYQVVRSNDPGLV